MFQEFFPRFFRTKIKYIMEHSSPLTSAPKHRCGLNWDPKVVLAKA